MKEWNDTITWDFLYGLSGNTGWIGRMADLSRLIVLALCFHVFMGIS